MTWPAPYNVVVDADSADRCLRWLGGQRPVLAIDTETDGLHWWEDRMRLLVLGDERRSWVVPTNWAKDDREDTEPNYCRPIAEKLAKYSRPTTFANAKFDLHVLEHYGTPLKTSAARDIQTMSRVLNPNDRAGLKVLGTSIDPNAALLESWQQMMFKSRGWTWSTIPWDNEVYLAYAANDAYLTARLDADLWPRIVGKLRDVYDLDWKVDLICGRMEEKGVRIDVSYCEKQAANLEAEAAALHDALWTEYGIDAGSNDQVAARLDADHVRLPKTPGGKLSVAAAPLAACDHPLAKQVSRLRSLRKFAESYYRGMLRTAEGDIVHPNIRAMGARTGRMSVSDPPFQQLPRTKEVRDTVIPREGNVLVKADYEQIEARILADYTRDPGLIAAFESGEDFFVAAMRQLYGDDTITKDDPRRPIMKGGVYAIMYGAGVAKFAETVKLPLADAERFMLAFHQQFPGVHPFLDSVVAYSRDRQLNTGEALVRTKLGRRELVPPGSDKHYGQTNSLIQGSAADIFKQGMVRVSEVESLIDYMILPVHDEQLLDVPEEYAEDVARALEKAMSDTGLAVPCPVQAKIVKTWGEGYPEGGLSADPEVPYANPNQAPRQGASYA